MARVSFYHDDTFFCVSTIDGALKEIKVRALKKLRGGGLSMTVNRDFFRLIKLTRSPTSGVEKVLQLRIFLPRVHIHTNGPKKDISLTGITGGKIASTLEIVHENFKAPIGNRQNHILGFPAEASPFPYTHDPGEMGL